MLRHFAEARHGRPVLAANLSTGEGIERVLAFIAAAMPPLAPEATMPPVDACKQGVGS